MTPDEIAALTDELLLDARQVWAETCLRRTISIDDETGAKPAA